MDQTYGLGLGQLDLAQQGQDWGQMIGLEGIDFRNQQYGDQRSDYQDQLMVALLGMTPVPGMNPVNPYAGYGYQSQGNNPDMLGNIASGIGDIYAGGGFGS